MAYRLRTYEYECQYCHEIIEITTRQPGMRRFCSVHCSNKHMHKNRNIPIGSREAKILRKGIDVVLAEENARLIEFTCIECGKENRKNKYAAGFAMFCNQTCSNRYTSKRRPPPTQNARKNMKKAQKLRRKNKPESQYSFSTIKGWYRGLFFYSSYEYVFMKRLEMMGLDVRNDLEIEYFSIPYMWEGQEKDYLPDYYIPAWNKVYEIKSSYSLKNDPKVAIKERAAISFLQQKNIDYQILTEKELFVPKNIADIIRRDPCAVLYPKKGVDDQLQMMFNEQEKFMRLLQEKRNFPNFPLDLKKKEDQKLVKEIMHECMHELFEAIHLLKNSKSHRQTNVEDFDREEFLEEMADVMHYLIEIWILLGYSAKDAFIAFAKKATINGTRILDGY